MKKIAYLLTILMVFSSFIWGAMAEGMKVNVAALKEIEEEDNFPIFISKKEVQKTTGLRFGDCDYLLITISNNLEQDISGISIELVAYDENECQVEIGNGYGSIIGIKTPQSFSATVPVNKHSEKILTLKCNSESFSGVRVIVASYTLLDNITVENENAEEWYESVYSNHVMDIIDFEEEENYSNTSFSQGKTINIANLKAIEEADSFPLKVTQKKIRKNAGNEILANDLLILTIQNNSNIVLYNPVLYAVTYNKEYEPKSLGIIKAEYPYVQILTAKENESIVIMPNSKLICRMNCSANDITGLKAIVASYEDENGIKYENPSAAQWLTQMLESNMYEID